MRWIRGSPYSIRADGFPYAVSRAVTPAGERFSAWHGPAMKEGGRGYFPELLGVFETAPEAKAACVRHGGSGFSPARASADAPASLSG